MTMINSLGVLPFWPCDVSLGANPKKEEEKKVGAEKTPPPQTPVTNETPQSQNALITWPPTLVQEMSEHDPANWEMANWSNGNPFNNTWQSDNVSFVYGRMALTLDNNGCPNNCDNKPYASGEYRTTQEIYGYGYYEASMMPAQGNGLMSGSFFTYRGIYGQASHDEIDIEFLGKSCNSVQLNYYVEGRGNHERIVALPFDACQEFHNYGFRWSEASLIFYIDGREVYRAIEDPSTPEHDIPYRPGKIMANLWAGTSEVDAWLNGPFKYRGLVGAGYDWIKYSTLDKAKPLPAPPTSHPKPILNAATTPAAPINILNIKDIQQGSFSFNGGSVDLSGGTYQFSANEARDPGFGILTGNRNLEGRNTLKFEIKGNLTKHGNYARLIVQIYDDGDNDDTPSVSLDPVQLTNNFQTITVNLSGRVDNAKKVQFLLVTDNGSCKVEIKNLGFE